jgi:formate/nitrite transporter FocA (FNT family)
MASEERMGKSNSAADGLKETEQRQVEKRMAPRAVVVHEAIRWQGEEELKRPASALFWSALAAGLSMGFSMVSEGLLEFYLPAAAWQPLVSKLGYSVGFLIVILGRQQLFTENTLTAILPLLGRRHPRTLLQVLRLWSVVLLANLLGAFLFAWAIAHTEVFDPAIRQIFAAIGSRMLAGDFVDTVVRAVFAGWLIALMVWLLPFAETARVTVIVILTYLIGLGHFSHIIAGSVETLYLVVSGGAGWHDYVVDFFAPTLLGNLIGGIALVSALNHAQVTAGGGHNP